MGGYVIVTDSGCDLSPELLRTWGVRYRELTVIFQGTDEVYRNWELDTDTFYRRMRNGEVARTSAVNPDMFYALFEEVAKEGKDVLYLGFSSGLSATCQSAEIAAERLREDYPDRKVITVDTLAASAGHGLLLALAVQKKEAGATLEETAQFAEEMKLKICHWFTVDDLVYLKRGGRVSAAAAVVAGVLNVKPVLHVDDEGHLINMSKVRGRKNALKALADKYGELADLSDQQSVFIGQADCREDAEFVAELLRTRYQAKVELIADIGPVIGAHAGPGTLALFFVGAHR